MKSNLLPIPHPGEVLLEDYVKPLGLSTGMVAKGLGIEPTIISDLIRGKIHLSPELALRLSHYTGTTAEFWLGLQKSYDLGHTERRLGLRILREVTPLN